MFSFYFHPDAIIQEIVARVLQKNPGFPLFISGVLSLRDLDSIYQDLVRNALTI